MLDPNCPQCMMLESDGEPLEEVFIWMNGMAVYEVDKARDMIKDRRTVYELETSVVAGWVSYTGDPKTFNFLATGVCEQHIDHVPDSKDDPIIFAYSLRYEGKERSLRPIDGHHRIARAIKYSQPLVYAVVLSEEETDSILTDNRPRKPRKVRRTRKKTA